MRTTQPTAPPPPHRRSLGRPSLVLVLATAALLALALAATSALAAPPTSFGGPEGEGAGEFVEPKGIAIDQQSGDAIVVDRNNQRVEKFGPDGEFLLAWGWGVADGTTEAAQICTTSCFGGVPGEGVGQLDSPEGIAVDNDPTSTSQGDVYVVDSRNNRVEKFGPEGEFLLMIGGEVDKTTGAEVCSAEDISVAHDSCGAGVEGSGHGEFERLGVAAVAVGPDGTLYVGDSERVQRFSPAGSFEGQTSFPGAGVVERLAVDSDGALYVASSGLDGVRKYDVGGTELGEPRDPSASAFSVAIAIGPTNQLLVFDRDSAHVLSFDSTGDELSATVAPAVPPRGIAFSEPSGRLDLLTAQTVQVLELAAAEIPYLLPGSEYASDVEPTSATLGASLNPEGGEETIYRFQYGSAAGNYPEETPASTPLETIDEVQTVTLKATTGSYLLRFKDESTVEIPFEAEASEIQGDLEALAPIGAGDVSVTGPPGGPYVIEFLAALGGADQPQLEAESINLKEVTEEGGEERIKAGTVSVATTRPGADLFTDRPVSTPISGLLPGKTYHFRAVATNKAGETAVGPDETFTTLPPISIEAASAKAVSATAATLELSANPHHLLSEYRFEYGLTTTYGALAPVPDGSLGEGGEAVTRTVAIQGLQPATTYHFRVVAHNALGTVAGEDHTFTTQSSAAALLPDGRAWELVSPPDKHGAPLESLAYEGADIQAAANGSAITYVAKGPITDEPAGNRSVANSQILSIRNGAGWTSEGITTPHQAISGLFPGRPSEYMLFSNDLLTGLVEPDGATPLSALSTERTPYLRQADGTFLPLVIGCPSAGEPCPPAIAAAANVPAGTHFGGDEVNPESEYFNFSTGVQFKAASPDLRHLVLSAPQVLTADFAPGFESEFQNLYEWGAGSLRLVSQIPALPETSCGAGGPQCTPAAEAGASSAVGNNDQSFRHAVSDDGSRVVFEVGAGGNNHLYLRDLSRDETVWLDAAQIGPRDRGGQLEYATASADDSKIFFTDNVRLTADSSAGPEHRDLYMCEVVEAAGHLSCSLRDLSAEPTSREPGDVLGTPIGASEDGSIVYFVANGALGSGADPGNCQPEALPRNAAPAATCNLFRYDTETETRTLVATIAGRDGGDWNAAGGAHDLGTLSARVSPNGRWLAFMSSRPLSGYDNRDASSGRPDEEVYLYDSAAAGSHLICASCNPSGARPNGQFYEEVTPTLGPLVDRAGYWQGVSIAALIPGWTKATADRALYQSRYLSNTGRLFFDAADSLVAADSNGSEDVYQYEPLAGPGQPASNNCTATTPTFSAISGGCVSLISAGTSGGESAFLDASESGEDVFFLTRSPLVGQDTDNALDIYDAHVCSSSLPCISAPAAAPEPCKGEACQPFTTSSTEAIPGTSTFQGPGNLVRCPKGKVKKSGRCAKKTKPHKHHHKSKKRHAKSNRGAGK